MLLECTMHFKSYYCDIKSTFSCFKYHQIYRFVSTSSHINILYTRMHAYTSKNTAYVSIYRPHQPSYRYRWYVFAWLKHKNGQKIFSWLDRRGPDSSYLFAETKGLQPPTIWTGFLSAKKYFEKKRKNSHYALVYTYVQPKEGKKNFYWKK